METFNEIAADALKHPIADIKDSLTPEDVPEWDSMNYLMLIANLEKHFKISFSMDEVLNAKSLGDIRAALIAKGISA